jgi:hypothetical protein
MVKIYNSSLETISQVIQYYNVLIFDDAYWQKLWIWKIAEVTYDYHKGTNINETLFVDIWWLSIEQFLESSSDKQQDLLHTSKTKIEVILWKKITLINEVLQLLADRKKIPCFSEEEKIEREIFASAVTEKRDILKYCLLGLNFEAEKAGLILNKTVEEIAELEKEIHKYETQLFGWEICDNQQEVVLAYEYIYNKFIDYKELLSIEQSEELEKYIIKIKNYLPLGYVFKKHIITPKIESKYLWYTLDRADYLLAFNMLVDSFGTLHHIVKSNEHTGSISDGPEWTYFPLHEKFDTITLERFLKLWMHEIETHSVTHNNSLDILWNLRGSNSTKKDEGLAMLMEQLFIYGENILSKHISWIKLLDKNKLEINSYLSKTLMWEILDNTDFLRFLELSEIIDPDTVSPHERFMRLKRNNLNGVQHKDTAYTRGLLQAIDEINLHTLTQWKKWISAEDLFIWKISFEETDKFKQLKNIKQEKWIQLNDLKPIFVSDAVYYIIEHKINGKDDNLNEQDFLKYLQKKYPLLWFINELDLSIYFWKYSRVIWIANILLNTIEKQHHTSIPKTVYN